MSEERAELVRRAFEALSRGDYQTLLAALDPQVTLRTLVEDGRTLNPDIEPVYTGTEGMMDFLATFTGVFDAFGYELDAVDPVGEDHVLVRARLVGRGKGSGAPVERPMTIVCEVREGRILALEAFSKPEEARARLGLA